MGGLPSVLYPIIKIYNTALGHMETRYGIQKIKVNVSKHAKIALEH